MRGGLVFFRGAGSAARAYLESDHSHADEYYLEGGAATAVWTARDASGAVVDADSLDGASYQEWVDWMDPRTGEVRGRPRDETRIAKNGEIVTRPASPRFAEMTVNCDKSLSVAAALFPDISSALDDAQAQAAEAMGAYLAKHSVTRTGPRGAQSLVPVERMEQVTVVHRTSRAGDPHRHVHVQWNTRVFASGRWRGLHTAATLKQQGALRGVASAVIAAHPGLRDALTACGLSYDAESGKVTELEAQSRLLSKRAGQVTANVAKLEASWREDHPGLEPSGQVRRVWDQQAWAMDRPQKTHATGRAEAQWVGELRDAKLQTSHFTAVQAEVRCSLEEVDAAVIARRAIAALEERQSAWSVADLEGAIGLELSKSGVVAERAAIEPWLRAHAVACADALLRLDLEFDGVVPEWVRWVTSERVVAVERELRDVFERRALESVLVVGEPPVGELSQAQSDAARALGGTAPLVVVEGAAGAGKTTMLAEARDLAAEDGRRLVVVAPTLRAANEAGDALGTAAHSAHKLAHEHGFRRNSFGEWTRLDPGDVDRFGRPSENGSFPIYSGPGEEFVLDASTRLVVDEAGMVDQDVALALVRIAEESQASLGVVGDRAQLAAVGRGGVLDLVVGAHPTPIDLAELHRFTDQEYAELTLQMRDRTRPGELFDALYERGNVRVHDTVDAVQAAITGDAVARARAGQSIAIAVASNDDAVVLNTLVQQAHADAGHTKTAGTETVGSDHLVMRVGDRVMTRKNDRELRVANRDVWTVQRVHHDRSVTVTNGSRSVRLPGAYVAEHTQLAYASTEYGVQGATVQVGHGVVTDSTSAAAAYVAATRGREANTLHVVAETIEQARDVFVAAMGRESGDRGIESARDAALRDLSGLRGSRTPVTGDATAFAEPTREPVEPREARQAAVRRAASTGSHADSLRRYLGRERTTRSVPVSVHVPSWAVAAAERSGRGSELTQRWRARAEQLAANPPAWAAELGPVPIEAGARARWMQLATEVAAYRARTGLTHQDGPAIPDEHGQHPVTDGLRARIADSATTTAPQVDGRQPRQLSPQQRTQPAVRDHGREL